MVFPFDTQVLQKGEEDWTLIIRIKNGSSKYLELQKRIMLSQLWLEY